MKSKPVATRRSNADWQRYNRNMKLVAALFCFPFLLPAAPTFSRDVSPILFKHCSGCHRPGEVGPMALTNYKEVRPWAKAIQAAVLTRKMPPWHADPHYGTFRNDSRLKDAEIEIIVSWARNGAAEGNPEELAPLPQLTSEWQIGKPDAIYSIDEFTLGSNGPEDQQTFTVETKLKQAQWVEAVEIRPGNRKVVHHVQVSIDGVLLATYLPGAGPEAWPNGTARFISPGATLQFIIHYAPGKDEKDKTSLGLRFAKQPPLRELRQLHLTNSSFVIPANAEKHTVTAWIMLQEDTDVLSYLARMNYRGRTMRFEAVYPDSRKEILLDIQDYDVAWQTKYWNAKPIRLPKGTRVQITATYDNSANNRSNPDPSKNVRWGPGPQDEVMDGWLEFTTPLPY